MAARDFSTLVELLEGMQDIHPDRGIRLVSPHFREAYYPYRELYRRVLFHADHLLRQDIEAGQKVVVPLTTDVDVIGSFLALVWIGAVPVSVSGQLAGQDRSAYVRQVFSLRERFGFDRVLVDRALGTELADDVGFDPLLTADPYPPELDPDRTAPRVPAAPARPDDLAFIQFSSGSTGDPKGVQITHRNLCTNLKLIVNNDGRSERDVGLIWLPLYHDMGLVGGFLSNLVHHNTLVLLNPVCFLMKPVTWLDYASRYRCTISAGPNFAFDMCNTRVRDSHLEARKPDLGSLAYIYNGSEPINPDVVERFYERFEPYGLRRGVVHPVYGMAEATLIVTAAPRGADILVRAVDGQRVVCVGRPLGDFEVRIADEAGRELPPDVAGEIVVRGSSVTPGYYANPEENGERFRDGWFRTGDLGLLDGEGRLFVTGRIKDLIIVNGRNYYAHDIAAKIEELPFVRRGKTHVFGYNLAGREQVIVMTVPETSMSTGVRAKLDELKRFLTTEPGSWLLKRLGKRLEEFVRTMNPQDTELLKEAVKQYLLREFGLPIHDVFLVPKIPRTSSGKVRRHECEAMYEGYLQSAARGSASRPSADRVERPDEA